MSGHRKKWLAMLQAYSPEQAERWVAAAIQADPTSSQAYVAWILRETRDEVIRLPEEVAAVRELLARWEKVKAADAFCGERDINRYGYYGLRRLVQSAALKESQRRGIEKLSSSESR